MPPIMFIGPMLRLSFLVEKRINEVLRRDWKMGVSQFKMLFLLGENHNVHQRDIADSWGMTEAAVSRQMGILQKAGLIERKKVQSDARSKIFTLTAKGKLRNKEATKTIDTEIERIFKSMDTKERKSFAKHILRAFSCIENAGYAEDILFAKRVEKFKRNT